MCDLLAPNLMRDALISVRQRWPNCHQTRNERKIKPMTQGLHTKNPHIIPWLIMGTPSHTWQHCQRRAPTCGNPAKASSHPRSIHRSVALWSWYRVHPLSEWKSPVNQDSSSIYGSNIGDSIPKHKVVFVYLINHLLDSLIKRSCSQQSWWRIITHSVSVRCVQYHGLLLEAFYNRFQYL